MPFLWCMNRFIATLLLLVAALGIQAQSEDAKYYCITLTNNVRHCGTLVADDGREITLQTQSVGTLILPKSDIRLMQQTDEKYTSGALDDVADRIYDPARAAQATRYFFAPSGITLQKGEGYGHLSVGMANVTYAFSDRLMGGISLGFGGFGFTVKHGLKFDEQWWGSFGLLQSFDWEDGSSATTLPFANVTYGDQQSHITVGGGLLARAIPNSAAEFDTDGLFYIAGNLQISDQAWLMTENYFGSSPFFAEQGDRGMAFLGFRRYKERKNRLTDYGLMVRYLEKTPATTSLSSSLTQFRPWLGFTWPF